MVSVLTKEIAFYRKYHRNPVNVGLHIVGIPVILTTSMYILTKLRVPGSAYLTLGLFTSLYYLYYYTWLDGLWGASFGSLLTAVTLYFSKASLRNQHYGLAWALWATGWIAQFIGHGVFEGRAPALFDNLHQALVLAPYFAFLEIAAWAGVSHAEKAMEALDARPTRPASAAVDEKTPISASSTSTARS